MANVKISQLPAATTPLTGVEQVALVQNGVTRRATVNSLKGPDGVRFFQTYATMTALTAANGRVDGMVVNVASRATAGDGGGGTFRYSAASVATANGGTVLAADDGVGRWLRVYVGPLHVKWFGAVGDGSTNDSVAVQAALTAAANGQLYFDPGTYLVDPPMSGPGNCEVFGASSGASTIKHRGATTVDNGLFEFVSKDNVVVHDLTFDWNNTAFVTTPSNIGFVFCNNIEVYNCQIIKIGKLGIGVNACNDIRIHDNYIARDTASTAGVNEAILLTESGGSIGRAWIENNRCVNTGMLLDGSFIVVRNNLVTGWRYGAGVGLGNNASNIYAVIDGNYFSNGYNGVDSDGFSCKGIEFFGTAARITNNICWNNSGPGIFCAGQSNVIQGNLCYNNGLYTAEVSAGIVLGYLDATYNASNCVVTGNKCFDTLAGAGTQDYGISIAASVTGLVIADNNTDTNVLGGINASASQTFYGPNASNSTTSDLPSIANGASTSLTITVAGAAFGDFVEASCSISLAGLSITGYVSAANAVTLIITNNTGGAVDLGSATFRARASRPLF